MTDTDLPPTPNVRAAAYSIACSLHACKQCGAETDVVALGLPPEHETADPDQDSDLGSDGWFPAGAGALIFYIEWLPEAVAHRIRALSPTFRPVRAGAASGSYWTNHCRRCDAPFDDHELHCEPEAAFVPTNLCAAARIAIARIDEPMAAVAAGYSLAPEFLQFGFKS